jgi:hypothetical protein
MMVVHIKQVGQCLVEEEEALLKIRGGGGISVQDILLFQGSTPFCKTVFYMDAQPLFVIRKKLTDQEILTLPGI